MPDVLIYRGRQKLGVGGGFMCLTCQATEKDHWHRSPPSACTGRAARERQAKEAYSSPASRGTIKTLIGE